jgi:CheY-like chemotaxis protein
VLKIDLDYFDVAFNGEEALRLVKEDLRRNGRCSFDIIFMDCNMPFMNGY